MKTYESSLRPHRYYRTKDSKTHGRGQCTASVSTAWGILPLPFSSKKVGIVLRQALLPDCTHIGFCDGFTIHCKIIVHTVTWYCFSALCEQLCLAWPSTLVHVTESH